MTTTTADSTATTTGARAHARAQAGTAVDAMPIVPASGSDCVPEGVAAQAMMWSETVPGGRYTNKTLARGTRIRLTDNTGTGCAHVLLWRSDAPWERLNVADTVKVPWQAYMSEGHPLLSDQGRVLATVIADTSSQHDALCGTTTLEHNTAKYGAGDVHSASPAGRELFKLAAAKHGMTTTDVGPSISFFHGIRVRADGSIESVGSAGAGKHVDLILHLPCVVAIVNTAHPMDPAATFDVGPIQVLAWRAGDDLAAQITRTDTDPEYRRAVANSEDAYFATTQELS